MTYESEVEMMRCMNCYQEIPDSCKFCPNCGAKQPVQKMEPVSQVKEETTDNITEDTAEVQQPTEKVQSEEDVLPEEKVQPEEDVQPTEPTQPADVAGSYQNDPYKSVNQEQNTSYNEPNNYEYGQGYGQQNQNYNQQNQGYYQQNNFNGMPQKPVNWVPYLILSIISTLCCCLPFGVVGIVFSAKINSAMLAGNLEEAQNNAKMARIWIIVSFAIGLLTWLIYMVLIVTGAVSGSAYYYY
ncbi:CD225/dispanin family protein [Mediterraneibacter faecis]|uniref:CD225/dispanin family protein n=1 Tax=Mediterraneibacter faecis TaxID=592978 RepID=UPI001D028656|nr:CD225/dispanin family protein [Mediterraneibacter faecis]MCB5430433.1 CD225/dispanin family protein [Mediterraneibacter faecis]